MVLEFNVLRCFSCRRFQVHQVKKAKKWICKVCGEKQSISKIYGQGSAPDCRRHVQKLNTIQGEREQLMGEKVMDDVGEEFDGCEVEVADNEQFGQEDVDNERPQPESKWKKFVEEERKNEEMLEEEFLNGIPVTMDKKVFDDGTKKGKQPKNWKKNTQSSDEFLPKKKRLKTQNFENGEDEFPKGNFSKKNTSKNMNKVNGMKEKSRSKWEIFNSLSEDIPDVEEVSSKKYDGILVSKPINYETFNLNDSPVKNALGNSQSVVSKSINPQAKRISKTSQSKWSKFLGASNLEEDEVNGRNDESYSRSGVSENSQENKQLVIPERPMCDNTTDANTLEIMHNISNYSQYVECNANNVSNFPIPSFVLNARATRAGQEAGKPTNSCQLNRLSQEPISFTSKDLFTIDDELGDEWWNV